MAGVMACSNEDGNEAAFMVSNLAGDQVQWVCPYCLGTLGMATLVELGAFTQAAAQQLMETGEAAPAAVEPSPAQPQAGKARKRAAGKATGTAGGVTPIEPHECAGKFEGCDGVGVHEGPAQDGGAEWLCNPCFALVGGAATSLGGN